MKCLCTSYLLGPYWFLWQETLSFSIWIILPGLVEVHLWSMNQWGANVYELDKTLLLIIDFASSICLFEVKQKMFCFPEE